MGPWFGPSWSLTIEEWSYLALPLLAFYVCRKTGNPLRSAALILCLAGTTVRLAIGLLHGPWSVDAWDVLIRKTVISRSDAVAYGVLAAVFFAGPVSQKIKYGLLPFAALLLGWNVWICLHIGYVSGIAGWLVLFPITGTVSH